MWNVSLKPCERINFSIFNSIRKKRHHDLHAAYNSCYTRHTLYAAFQRNQSKKNLFAICVTFHKKNPQIHSTNFSFSHSKLLRAYNQTPLTNIQYWYLKLISISMKIRFSLAEQKWSWAFLSNLKIANVFVWVCVCVWHD